MRYIFTGAGGNNLGYKGIFSNHEDTFKNAAFKKIFYSFCDFFFYDLGWACL